MTRIAFSAAIATLAFYATGASAAAVTHSNQSLFLAAAADTLLESFENGNPANWGASGTILTGNNGGHRPTHGARYKTWGSPTTTSPAGFVVIDFAESVDTPVSAIGFSITDFGDTSQPIGYQGQLKVTDDLGREFLVETNPPIRPSGEELFFGLISDEPVRRLVIEATTINDGLGYDEVYYRYAVPEPSGGLLLFVAAGLLLRSRAT